METWSAVGQRQELLADVVAVLAGVKLRTQPTWSGGSPLSISDSATAGCHAVWLLKSRSTAQTRSMGASMTARAGDADHASVGA